MIFIQYIISDIFQPFWLFINLNFSLYEQESIICSNGGSSARQLLE